MSPDNTNGAWPRALWSYNMSRGFNKGRAPRSSPRDVNRPFDELTADSCWTPTVREPWLFKEIGVSTGAYRAAAYRRAHTDTEGHRLYAIFTHIQPDAHR